VCPELDRIGYNYIGCGEKLITTGDILNRFYRILNQVDTEGELVRIIFIRYHNYIERTISDIIPRSLKIKIQLDQRIIGILFGILSTILSALIIYLRQNL